MNEWAGLFLGIIALTALVQCAFVVLAARSLLRTGERVEDLCRRFDHQVKPILEDLRGGAANLRAISDSGREQAAKVEALLATTLETVETTVENVRVLVEKPLAGLSDLAAFWSGLRRGVDAYRSSRPKRRTPPVTTRRSEDSDEHLFIG